VAQVTYTYAEGMDEAECLDLCASVETCVAFTIGKHRCGIAETCKYRTTIDSDAVTETYVKPSEVESNAELFANLQTTAARRNPAALYKGADKCDFCDPTQYGPCFDEPICRMGKCFRGTQLPDGRNCDDKDQTTFNDRCHKGTCQGEAIRVLPLSDHQGASCFGPLGVRLPNSGPPTCLPAPPRPRAVKGRLRQTRLRSHPPRGSAVADCTVFLLRAFTL